MKSEKKNKKLDKKQVVEADITEEKVSKKNKKVETVEKIDKKADKKVKKVEKKDKKKDVKVKKAKGEGFFKEVIKELKRVKWPDKKYMVKYATATFVTIIVSSLYFYAIFALFSYLKGLR